MTPNADGWRALAEAEYGRARGAARPDAWSEAAAVWERLERPPIAAYCCRWRQAEALAGASADATARCERPTRWRRRWELARSYGNWNCSPTARSSNWFTG